MSIRTGQYPETVLDDGIADEQPRLLSGHHGGIGTAHFVHYRLGLRTQFRRGSEFWALVEVVQNGGADLPHTQPGTVATISLISYPIQAGSKPEQRSLAEPRECTDRILIVCESHLGVYATDVVAPTSDLPPLSSGRGGAAGRLTDARRRH